MGGTTVMKSRKYYTPVEFARLFRIDRQTLIYYDNHGIFSPSLKNGNGGDVKNFVFLD